MSVAELSGVSCYRVKPNVNELNDWLVSPSGFGFDDCAILLFSVLVRIDNF